jgi:hypothetical protein
MQCDICGKEFKGKIGVGVHLKRSHTREERSRLYVKRLTDCLPLIMTTMVVYGVSQALGGSSESGISR